MLNALTKQLHANAVEKGFWNTDQPDYNTKLLLVISEITEAMEELRKGNDPKTVYRSPEGKPEGFAIELIDAFIRILDLLGYLDMDVHDLMSLKHNYNLTRPPMHGKQF